MIQISKEALLSFIQRRPPSSGVDPAPSRCKSDRFDFVNPCIRREILDETYPVGKLREAYDDDDDCATASTAGLSSDDSIAEREVSFAEPLVTDVWTREYTSKDEIADLYYSSDDCSR